MSESVVYAIDAGGRVKIGRTVDLPRRMSEIQVTCPDPIVCLGTAPGGAALEKALHRQFGRHRCHGEWFNLGPDDRKVLLARLSGEPYFIRLPRAGPREMLPEVGRNRKKYARLRARNRKRT